MKFCEIQKFLVKRCFSFFHLVALWVFQEVDFVSGLFFQECLWNQYLWRWRDRGLTKREMQLWCGSWQLQPTPQVSFGTEMAHQFSHDVLKQPWLYTSASVSHCLWIMHKRTWPWQGGCLQLRGSWTISMLKEKSGCCILCLSLCLSLSFRLFSLSLKMLLCVFHVPGTVSSSGNLTVNKTEPLTSRGQHSRKGSQICIVT